MNLRIVTFAFVAWACAAASASAQVRPGRSLLVCDDMSFATQADRSFELRWRWQVSGITGAGLTALPFDVPGDVVALGADRVLVSGLTSADGLGWVATVRFSLSSGQVVGFLEGVVSSGQFDGYKTWSNGSDLMLLDYNAGVLVHADITSGLAGATFAIVADSTSIPLLGDQRAIYRLAISDAEGPLGGCQVGPDPDWLLPSSVIYRVTRVNGVWTVLNETTGMQVPTPVWVVDVLPSLASNGVDYLLNVGGGSGQFVLKDVDTSTVVFSGNLQTIGGAPAAFTIPGGALVYGHRYRIESAASQIHNPSAFFRMFMHWQVGVSVPGYATDRVYVRWDYPSVGNATISWRLNCPSGNHDPILVGCYVGPWDYGAVPHAPSGLGFNVLQAQYGMLGPMVASCDTTRVGVASFSLDVNNPAFTGTRIAFHFVGLLTSFEFITSDVDGVVLH